MSILDFFKNIGITRQNWPIIVLIVMTIIEITPIKINPWSAIGNAIGKAINKSVMKEIADLKKEASERDENLNQRINENNAEVKEHLKKLDESVGELDSKISEVSDKNDEERAVTARVRILRFCDELQEEKRHSKDSFDQVMCDITCYNQYCKDHPTFKNNQTVSTVEYITKVYQERLEKHDFL